MKHSLSTLALAASLLGTPWLAQAQTSIGLQNYQLVGNFAVPTLGGLALELSALTYAPDRGTLFAVGDEGLGVIELTTSGQVLGSMAFDWTGTGSSKTTPRA